MKKTNIKKEAAKTVYLSLKDIYTVKEIADTLGIAERTLYDWAKQEGWDETAKANLNTKEAQITYLYSQLDKLKTETKDRLMTSKEADIHAKLVKSINLLEDKTSLVNTLAVLKELALHAALTHTENLDLIKGVINDFITHKAKHQSKQT